MTGITRIARLGFLLVVGAIFAVATSGEAAAKHHKASMHSHQVNVKRYAQALPQKPVRLGTMRYYGGPKSPMWRGPVEADVKPVQVVQQQPVRLGAMRYYGGPKSPMWRGPVED